MSFPIRPPDGGPGTHDTVGRVDRRPEPPRADAASFARVYELEEARRRREIPLPPIAGDRIPTEVWDEVEAASRLVEDLAARGQRVTFDTDRLTGRVVATLLDGAGEASPMRLGDAVDPRAAGAAARPPADAPRPSPFERSSRA